MEPNNYCNTFNSWLELAKSNNLKVTAVNSRQKRFNMQCPAHDDLNPSLSIAETKNSIVLHCHAGCAPKLILNSLGIDNYRFLYKNPQIAVYRNSRNVRYFQVKRTNKYLKNYNVHEKQNTKETWRQGSCWYFENLFYKFIKPKTELVIFEGENKTELFNSLITQESDKYFGTCFCGGIQNLRNAPFEKLKKFNIKNIIFYADSDKIIENIRIAVLLKQKFDFEIRVISGVFGNDFIDNYYETGEFYFSDANRNKFIEHPVNVDVLFAEKQNKNDDFVYRIQYPEIEYVEKKPFYSFAKTPFIWKGYLTVLAADSGAGKSKLIAFIIANLINHGTSERFLIFSEMDAADFLHEVSKYLQNKNTDLNYFIKINPRIDVKTLKETYQVSFSEQTDKEFIDLIYKNFAFSTVIFDTLDHFIETPQTNAVKPIKDAFDNLKTIFKGKTIIALKHFNKDSSIDNLAYRVAGSTAYVACADTVICMVSMDRKNDFQDKYFGIVKNRFAKEIGTCKYEIQNKTGALKILQEMSISINWLYLQEKYKKNKDEFEKLDEEIVNGKIYEF